ncbi:unnamed protein product [Coregonus sp. 'balchen']|nr:unnamed protein product [Coregonus sp. 'balchen']
MSPEPNVFVKALRKLPTLHDEQYALQTRMYDHYSTSGLQENTLVLPNFAWLPLEREVGSKGYLLSPLQMEAEPRPRNLGSNPSQQRCRGHWGAPACLHANPYRHTGRAQPLNLKPTQSSTGPQIKAGGGRPFSSLRLSKLNKRIVYTVLEYSPLLDSCNITADDWGTIGKDIEKHYENYAGFVILHGTDTMAYTASALSFMCEHLGKPVILTGSQVHLPSLWLNCFIKIR